MNLVAEDVNAAVAFYRNLGRTVCFNGEEWPVGSGARHVALANGAGAILGLDNSVMVKICHLGWRVPGRSRILNQC